VDSLKLFFQKIVKQLTKVLSAIFLYIKKTTPFWSKKSLTDINSEKARRQTELDKKLVYSLSKSRIPTPGQFKYLKRYLTKGARDVPFFLCTQFPILKQTI